MIYYAMPFVVIDARFGMTLEFSPGELLTAFMHYDDKGHTALKHHAALKGLNGDITMGIEDRQCQCVLLSLLYTCIHV